MDEENHRAQSKSAVASSWWRSLQPDPSKGRPGDAGALARLRRTRTPLAALTEPATIDLARKLGLGPSAGDSLLRVGTLAAVLAAVREDKKNTRLGIVLGGENPVMSQLRLRSLLNARGETEILSAFRRVVALADGALPVKDLADTLLWWDSTSPRAPRTRLAFDYYGAGSAAPFASSSRTADPAE
jgi:CRISPR system Cascade subunit CasB